MIPIAEEDDIILPNNFWYELVYIYCMIEDIIVNRTNTKQKWKSLKRQIRIWLRWIRVK